MLTQQISKSIMLVGGTLPPPPANKLEVYDEENFTYCIDSSTSSFNGIGSMCYCLLGLQIIRMHE
ncbi:hypothetical protein CJ216_04690 [Gardnerella greenwoodii]|uniref:Uncharacterized protein n=1 Tax=Gardnerella greenwoodii TaxID=2914925 RepID=A0A2N6RZ13_9BIFI|nr:hypothetical protein CJ216_04690 [Gardnerella greenwoodii]